MNTGKLLTTVTLGILLPVALMQGCGGGGGGGGSSPSPTSTPTANARILVVQLRDSSGNPVDGIVTVGSTVVPTSSGTASIRGVSAGSVVVNAEVNGVTTTGTAMVASTGSTTFTLVISSSVTPGPTSTLPPPPAA